MLAIIVKDLVETYRTWLLFTGLPTLAILIIHWRTFSPERLALMQGLVEGMIIIGGLIFAQMTVVAERQRRHFILLKSLPITDRGIVMAKLVAVFFLTAGLCAVPLAVGDFLKIPVFAWSLPTVVSVALLYASALVFLAIRFNSVSALMCPMYLGLALIVFGDTAVVRQLSAAAGGLVASEWRLPLFCWFGIALFAELAVATFGKKELDF